MVEVCRSALESSCPHGRFHKNEQFLSPVRPEALNFLCGKKPELHLNVGATLKPTPLENKAPDDFAVFDLTGGHKAHREIQRFR